MIKLRKKRKVKRTIKKVVRAKRISAPKAKYKTGDFVYSPQNRTEKRQINAVQESKSGRTTTKYRLTLSDTKGRPTNSKWISETSLSKRKKS